MCHCLACQHRTGAVISNQARFRRDQVTIGGKSMEWMRTAETGNAMTYHFCPTCGSTVYWENEGFPGQVNVAIGNFADPKLPRADNRGMGAGLCFDHTLGLMPALVAFKDACLQIVDGFEEFPHNLRRPNKAGVGKDTYPSISHKMCEPPMREPSRAVFGSSPNQPGPPCR